MKIDATNSTNIDYFRSKLKYYKNRIDTDIEKYSKGVQKSTLNHYGAYSRIAVDVYLDILSRGGKRIRGALAHIGYEMAGGKDQQMILEAARAVEMFHASILIIDDINDRSPIRRGGPTAHMKIADYHKKQAWADESLHFGESIAMNAALVGCHSAQIILANLKANDTFKARAISNINFGTVVTAHGQFNDMFNEVTGDVTEAEVLKVMEWKTANYTFLNPLTFGMVLAGADCSMTDAIRDYSLNAGKAFQVSDDILGTFGVEFESGKSPLDDIKEGKRTLLTIHALEHASRADKNFLIQMLGNHKLTPSQFNRCKDILIETGSLAYAQKCSDRFISEAIASLKKNEQFFTASGVKFLTGLAEYLAKRKA